MQSKTRHLRPSLVAMTGVLLAASCLCFTQAAHAQKATLVSDINKTRAPLNSKPLPKRADRNGYQEGTRFAQTGGQAVFQAASPKTSYEAFTSRGTKASSMLLKDISPGGGHGLPEQFTSAGSKFYFRAMDPVHGYELWVSDGTSVGTVLVADVEPGYSGAYPEDLCPLGNTGSVVFRAYNNVTGSELYVSDGTAKGTLLLMDIEPGSASSKPSYMRTFHDGKRDLVLFQAHTQTAGTELFVTDGTVAGTKLLKDIEVGGGDSNPQHFQVLGRKVLFEASTNSTGTELWITDGTAAGTTLVKDVHTGVQSGTDLHHAVSVGSRLYFSGTTVAAGKEIWVTDGTSAGTKLLADTNVGSGNGVFLYGTALGHRVLFQGSSIANGVEPWVLDSNTGFVGLLTDLIPGKWGSTPEYFLTSGNRVFFSAMVPQYGRELVISDGTATGTSLLRDIYPGASDSSPKYLTSLSAGRILFSAQHSGVVNLWTSDGTANGTIPVPVGMSQLPTRGSWIQHPVAFKDKLLFSADDGVTGSELWITDGTDKGTLLVKDLYPGADVMGWPNRSSPLGLTCFGNQVLFSADDGQGLGRELWTTDGTSQGTRILVDILGGPGGSYPFGFTFIGTRAFFSASGYDNAAPRNYVGNELFVTDGTAAGTRMVADLYPGFTSSSPRAFTEIGTTGRFVFSAFTPAPLSQRDSLGHELWVSDGSASGTTLLMDIEPGTVSSMPREFQAIGDKIYFVATTASHGDEIWVTDGTKAGTRIVKDLILGALSSKPRYLCALGGKLYFNAFTQSSGYELFESDGTSAGTKLFLDVIPGPNHSYPRDLTAVGSRFFYFSAISNGGQELWRSDGTVAGTAEFSDIWPGWRSSKARGFQCSHGYRFGSNDGRVFVAAALEATGEELYYVENGASATPRGQGCGASYLLSTDPVMASMATVSGTTQAGFLANLLLLGVRPNNSIPLGSGCRLYLDLTGPLIVLQTSIGQSFSTVIPIPSMPALLRAHLRLQSLHPGTSFPSASGYSNAIDWTLGK